MAIKCNMNEAEFNKHFDSKVEELNKKILTAFIYAGNDFVTACRNQPADHSLGFYLNDTNNLRNSIGYYIYQWGEEAKAVEHGTASDNRQLVSSVVSKQGFQLIGVAGMNYASYVEAKGYNVLTIQKNAFFVKIKEYLKEVKKWADGKE